MRTAKSTSYEIKGHTVEVIAHAGGKLGHVSHYDFWLRANDANGDVAQRLTNDGEEWVPDTWNPLVPTQDEVRFYLVNRRPDLFSQCGTSR